MKFCCQSCGLKYLKWVGRCNCGEWNSLETISNETFKSNKVGNVMHANLVSLEDQSIELQTRIQTNISEFNRVIGDGLVPGGVILISGDPGIGKSTLLLQICNSDFEIKKSVLYISGEESVYQVQLRAKRLNITNSNIKLGATNNFEEILSMLETHKDEMILVIIDSIQTIASENLDGSAGSIGQIRYCAQKLIEFAKSANVCVIIVGHITKEGTIAGPKVLEHSVDTVLHFEGERNYAFRILRTIKNRFGPTDEIGIFEISENGLSQVENPSMVFLNQQQAGVSGSVICEPSCGVARGRTDKNSWSKILNKNDA
jgi:DNA repair protein RadA/Sms